MSCYKSTLKTDHMVSPEHGLLISWGTMRKEALVYSKQPKCILPAHAMVSLTWRSHSQN